MYLPPWMMPMPTGGSLKEFQEFQEWLEKKKEDENKKNKEEEDKKKKKSEPKPPLTGGQLAILLMLFSPVIGTAYIYGTLMLAMNMKEMLLTVLK